MKSPVGSRKTLQRVDLEDGLVAYRCPETGGCYIKQEGYWRWQRQVGGAAVGGGEEAASDPGQAGEPPVSEFDEVVKICPESGIPMVRYRVGRGVPFRVDRSVTGGIWLDAGEWEALREDGLHRNLHRVFTAPWQRAIRDEELSAKREERLRGRLGGELFERLKSLREELWSHPSRPEALAFLQSEPPGKRAGGGGGGREEAV